MTTLEKYLDLAEKMNMKNACLIQPEQIVFDIRAILKCRWGCIFSKTPSIKCETRNTSLQERIQMVQAYSDILLLHSNDAHQLSKAVIEIERTAFLDGHHFAFGIRACHLCRNCSVDKGKACPTPEKIRPCEQSFGLNVYQTVRNLGLPCNVLTSKEETQNRYGFVLIT